MWPQRFGKIWSSMFMPATPIAISRSVIQAAFTALPPPVSTSAITGMLTACTMFQVRSSTSFIWTRPTSGVPSSEPARPKPEICVASKPQASMTLAEKASWQPGSTTARRSMIALRRVVVFFMCPGLLGDAGAARSSACGRLSRGRGDRPPISVVVELPPMS